MADDEPEVPALSDDFIGIDAQATESSRTARADSFFFICNSPFPFVRTFIRVLRCVVFDEQIRNALAKVAMRESCLHNVHVVTAARFQWRKQNRPRCAAGPVRRVLIGNASYSRLRSSLPGL